MLLDPGNNSTAAATISFNLTGETPLDFINGSVTYTQAPLSWRYFRVDVPTNAATALGVQGWEVRLADSPSDEVWTLRIRRDGLPTEGGWVGGHHTSWPSGDNYGGASTDWTGRVLPGMGNAQFFASMAWGRPLEPGTYFIGVHNGSAQARSIRLLSRAIGDAGFGLPITIQPLSFGASVTLSNVAPGSFHYFRLALPPHLPAAKFTLRALRGDARWQVRRGFVPGIDAATGAISPVGGQVGTSFPGNDYMIWWPDTPATTLPADDYYLVVAAEGSPTNPDNGRLGSGPTDLELSSAPFVPEDLGLATPAQPVLCEATYDAGEPLAFGFDLEPGARALEVRLENRVGNPLFQIGLGHLLSSGFQGWFGNNATNTIDGGNRFLVLPQPASGRYWLKAGHGQIGQSPPQAGAFTLAVRSLRTQALNFSSSQNTNGLTNAISGSLADGQRAYYEVVVPETLNGEPPLGWYLKQETLQGNPQVRVRRGASLPEDGSVETSGYFANGLVIAPPYFRPGLWTVEVRAYGDSQFALSSEPITLERPAWAMPIRGQTNESLFADSSSLPENAAPTNHVNLARERYHFYAVDVPEGNAGLMRVALIAHSGNPDLYVRSGSIPSREAAVPAGWPSPPWAGFHHFALTAANQSDFINWVPSNTRYEHALSAGRWYFMVHAHGVNARYQLQISTGTVTPLEMAGGSAANQTLGGNDWRYYRFVVPTNPPQFWDLNVTQHSGNVDAFLRDTAPPGMSYSGGASWSQDQKNEGVIYQSHPDPGTWRFTVPQIRPGHVYYVGVRALEDSTFSIASTTSGPRLDQAFPTLDWIEPEGGSVNLTLAPFERRTWRVAVPTNAVRWSHRATNASPVRLYLQNGSVPWASRSNPADHWDGGNVPNNSLKTALYDRASGTGWPWTRGETFFVAVTNESAVAQPFSLTVDTRAWRLELAATNGTITPSPNKPDYDHGEVVSLTPQPAPGYQFARWEGDLTGTNRPAQLTMAADRRVVAIFEPIPYQILIQATNGVVVKEPDTPTHTYGSVLRLTAIPNPGFEFVRWSGSLLRYDNPLLLEVPGNLSLTAEFVRVAFPPEIVAQPASGTFTQWQPATLAVLATGTAPLSYQWWRDSSPLPGATAAMLHFHAVSTNDVGNYSVTVSNVAGVAASQSASLNVRVIQSYSFTNAHPIVIRDRATADPYPSAIPVGPLPGTLFAVRATLHGLSHTWLEDVDALLAAPSGQAALLFSDAGMGPVQDLTLTLADDAESALPELGPIASGAYRPANYDGLPPAGDSFAAPAPEGPFHSTLGVLTTNSPAGLWQLFLVDDYGKDSGVVERGWSLEFQVGQIFFANPPPPPAIEPPNVTAGGELGFGFTGMTGHTVQIEASSNLSEWEVVSTLHVQTGEEQFIIPTIGSGRFFRVRVIP
jgi:hypothetical protein